MQPRFTMKDISHQATIPMRVVPLRTKRRKHIDTNGIASKVINIVACLILLLAIIAMLYFAGIYVQPSIDKIFQEPTQVPCAHGYVVYDGTKTTESISTNC